MMELMKTNTDKRLEEHMCNNDGDICLNKHIRDMESAFVPEIIIWLRKVPMGNPFHCMLY